MKKPQQLESWHPTRRTLLGGAASAFTLALAGCGGGGGGLDTFMTTPSPAPAEPITIIESFLSALVGKYGGATTAVAHYREGANDWVVFSIGNRLAVAPISASKGAVAELGNLPGAIQSITIVPGRAQALVAMGNKGLAVVNLSSPTAPSLVKVVSVSYERPAFTYVDGGGNQLESAAATLGNGSITHVLVYNDGTEDQLVIANESFGLQKTRLANLDSAASGSALVIDGPQAWTLKYAGENPWGGPRHLTVLGDKLYAALGFLGMAIYDLNSPTLARIGAYSVYGDANNNEDWFGKPHEKAVHLLSGDFIDADGMPTWKQAQLELQSHRSGTDLGTYPWARFDRYGKYYYQARRLAVVENLPGGKTLAYMAYGLGGLVAVDVTNPAAPFYAGYVPAVPAHGAEEPTGQNAQSILSHHGSGMLEEAGVADVRVVADAGGATYRAYMSEHFAGLVVVAGAEDPGTKWRNAGGPFSNDSQPNADYWPDYEFVTSYDMTPVPVGEESMPQFLVPSGGNYTLPILLATGEINGHGGPLFLTPNADMAASGQVDVVQASGAGGLSFIDIVNLTGAGVAPADRFSVPVRFASTAETGAAPAGEPTDVAIGHTEGVAVMGNHLFVADGPHGMSVWRIADGSGAPTDDLRLVANTLMDEYPTAGYIPASHAFGVHFGDNPNRAFVMCQSLGVRAVDVSPVSSGAPGAPVLLNILPSGIYEHSTEASGNVGGINGQDHAYGATFFGNYAIVADGGNGLTVYDVSVAANPSTGAHVVANLGGSGSGRPPLGRSSAVKLWKDVASGKMYAVVSAGPYGISVVDMTGLLVNGVRPGMTLIKTFEPIKLEEEEGEVHVGSADGKAVDIQIAGDIAYISYDSYGLVAYRMADLVRPLAEAGPACVGIDPTKVFSRDTGVDCRPVALGRYKLQADPAHPEFADVEGGAMYMTVQHFPANVPLRNAQGNVFTLNAPKTLLYVAYGTAGVVKLDWSNPASPTLLERQDTIGKAVGTAIANGRVYVADSAGGFAVFR